MSDAITNKILENATSPKKAASDAITVEQHSISEQIAADKYLAMKEALKSKKLGIYLWRIVPPGAA